MSANAHARWLLAELPALQAAGIVSADTAQRLRAHYAVAGAEPAKHSWALIICGVGSALLIGLGAILLIAHNWDAWSRTTRTVLSFAPLVPAQMLAGFALLRRAASSAWRESAAVAQCLAVAASIALVGQTYHIHGDLGAFLLLWMLLSLPLVYLLDSVAVALIYLTALVCWAWAESGSLVPYLALAAALVPYVGSALRRAPDSWRAATLQRAGVLALLASLPGAIGLSVDHVGPTLFAYACLFSLFALADARLFAEGRWRSYPPGALGLLGIAAIAISHGNGSYLELDDLFARETEVRALQAVLLAAAALLWARALRRRRVVAMLFGALPFLMLLGGAIGSYTAATRILFNVYVLALAIAVLREGVRDARFAALNLGLLILAAQILTQFLFSNLPYTARAAAFMVVGAGFLTANLYFRKRTAS